MLRKILHHGDADCGKVCCTKIENFGVKIGSLTVFENVNLHIHCGELTAIVGPNGAGKSTLLKAILGQVPHTGEMRYVDAQNKRAGKPVIGYVPQQLAFDKNSPLTVLDIFAAAFGKFPAWLFVPKSFREQTAAALARVQASDLIDRRLGALSGGQLQRVLLTLALSPKPPDLLLLDEPVSGVDREGLSIFYEMVSKLRETEDLAVILISHDLDSVARLADKVVLMQNGTATVGTAEEILGEF